MENVNTVLKIDQKTAVFGGYACDKMRLERGAGMKRTSYTVLYRGKTAAASPVEGGEEVV